MRSAQQATLNWLSPVVGEEGPIDVAWAALEVVVHIFPETAEDESCLDIAEPDSSHGLLLPTHYSAVCSHKLPYVDKLIRCCNLTSWWRGNGKFRFGQHSASKPAAEVCSTDVSSLQLQMSRTKCVTIKAFSRALYACVHEHASELYEVDRLSRRTGSACGTRETLHVR